MKLGFQIALLVLMLVSFTFNVYRDFEGSKQRPPAGFPGFIGSVLVTAGIAALYYFCGAFSEIVPSGR